MAMYINTEDFMDIIKKNNYLLTGKYNAVNYGMYTNEIQKSVNESSSVYIVFCVNCHYGKQYGNGKVLCSRTNMLRKSDDFCSDGT